MTTITMSGAGMVPTFRSVRIPARRSAVPGAIAVRAVPFPERGAGRGGRAGHGRTAAMPEPVGTLRLTVRGRVVLALLVATVVAVGWLVLGARGALADAPIGATVVDRHVVATGETLWGIASQVARPDQDVRDVVRELADLNDLSSSALVAGQTIVVPAGG